MTLQPFTAGSASQQPIADVAAVNVSEAYVVESKKSIEDGEQDIAKRRKRLSGRRIRARRTGTCGACGGPVEIGDMIWRLPPELMRYGDPGWICTACRHVDGVPYPPTLRETTIRIYRRWLAGKPVSLNSAEVLVLAEELLSADLFLTPQRRCEVQTDGQVGTPDMTWRSWDQATATVEEAVGYLLDSVEFGFACNVRTKTVLLLLEYLVAVDADAKDGSEGIEAACELVGIAAGWEAVRWGSQRYRHGKLAYAAQAIRTLPPVE